MNQASNNTSNVVNLHPVVIRLNPITNTPVVFIADKPPVDDQVELVLEGNEHRVVSYDYYKHTIALSDDVVNEVAHKYAEDAGIPFDAIHLRVRLPKKASDKPKARRQRKTNDANLSSGGAPFRRRASDVEEDDKDELSKASQNLHDSETKGHATPSNPEGATVTPIKAKRAYNRRDPQEKVQKAKSSKRSQAALARYHKEVQETAEKNNVLIEQAATSVDKEVVVAALKQLSDNLSVILAKIA